MQTPLLEMRGISKRFPGVVALDQVDFDLTEGEVHVLLGENGAGKSTLMKILSGAYQKDQGEILVRGRQAAIESPAQAQNLKISTIYQEFNLIPQLTVAENVFLGREPARFAGLLDRRRIEDLTAELLRELGLNIMPGTPAHRLSVAEQQMVEVAKALSIDARILIMDEPTSTLSETETGRLFQSIRKLQDKRVGIIYISHRLEEVRQIGDRVTVLRDGRRVAHHRLSEVEMPDLIREMANRELSEHFPKRPVRLGKEVLRVERLCSRSGVRSVSFALRRGEILGVAGLVGAGRTALARAIFGIDPIESGQITVRGKKLTIDSPRKAISEGIGLLTEDRKAEGLVLSMSVVKNISLPSLDRLSKWGFVDSNRESQLARRFIGELRIKTPGIAQPVLYLSGGNQQKVVLSKWLGRQADILIFDEPTRGIDVGAKVEIYEVMNRLVASGAGIIMISSELPEILGMSDRILVMSQGRLTAEMSRSEATQEKILEAALRSDLRVASCE